MNYLWLTFLLISLQTEVKQINTEHFIVLYDNYSADTARLASEGAEDAYVKVRASLGLEMNSKVTIVIKSAAGDFKKDQPAPPESVPDWAAGTAYPTRKIIFLRRPDGIRLKYDDVFEVVGHEYTHIAIGNFLQNIDVPRWFEEGVADFTGGERSLTASATIGSAALGGTLLSFDSIDRSWPESSGEAERAYAQSADFIQYLEDTYGPGTIKKILHAIKISGDFNKAVETVTNASPAIIQAYWLKHVTRVYRWIAISSGGVTLWTLAGILVIIGYFRKKKLNRLKIQMWEIEDKLRRIDFANATSSASPSGDKNNDDQDDDNPPPSITYH